MLLVTLADNKYLLGRRYAEWCTGAPALEAAVAAAAMAQDEIGHARSLYPLLRDDDKREVDLRTIDPRQAAPFLTQSFGGWVDFVAANTLFDTALTLLLESAVDSSFQPLAQRARRMIEEERLHCLHGEGWSRRLAREVESIRAATRAAYSRVLPDALAWFDVASPSLLTEGVLQADGSQLRQEYRRRMQPYLDEVGMVDR